MQVSKEALYNICIKVFKYQNINEDLVISILKLMDITIDFNKKSIKYYIDVDDYIEISYKEALSKFPHNWKITPVDLSYIIDEIEYRLNGDDPDALYPLFSAIGYILISDEGRWRIIKNDRIF